MDQLDTNVLKEPRGFLRVLQFVCFSNVWIVISKIYIIIFSLVIPQVFAICAFATTTNFGSYFSFLVKCKNETLGSTTFKQSIEYPFRC